ncbi:MAG: bacillithiol biosynthesis deacetylase BshB1 [Sediminibacterium sp.]|nr:bacillithiol biosynthesis deacetylase BshB1 [Sediminibacterium sp.]
MLVFGAHPDDIELGCAGTIISTIHAGKKVGVVDLTKGELGTRGNAIIRAKEAKKSATILGLSVRENLNLADGFFEINKKNILKVIQIIRNYQPSIILANAPTDRHPDHGRAANLLYEAFFLSGLEKIKTTFKRNTQPAWKPTYLFNYIQDKYIEPNILIDISDYIDKKVESINAYSSQFYNATNKSNEPSTYISTPQFLQSILHRNGLFGKRIGVNFAEGFLTSKIIGLSNFNSIIQNIR